MSDHSVLILSDKEVSTRTWLDAFHQRGLAAESTSSAASALDRWRAAPPMLTVVDLSLPAEESLQICRDLRVLGGAPILLILPSASGDVILEAYRAGVTECLIQPASPAVILLKALAWSMRAGWAWPVSAPISTMGFSE
ncbi:MAG: response regulator [Anaerolineaceae bacterium]|nr:MAG: response regulator [Anaerolineaceae bacterium]